MISLTFIDIFSENEDYISFQGQLNYTKFDWSFDWTEGGAQKSNIKLCTKCTCVDVTKATVPNSSYNRGIFDTSRKLTTLGAHNFKQCTSVGV